MYRSKYWDNKVLHVINHIAIFFGLVTRLADFEPTRYTIKSGGYNFGEFLPSVRAFTSVLFLSD